MASNHASTARAERDKASITAPTPRSRTDLAGCSYWKGPFCCLACELPIILSPFILMCFCVGFFGFYLPSFSFRGAKFADLLGITGITLTREEFTCAAFNPSGESVVLGNYNRILAPWSPLVRSLAHGSPWCLTTGDGMIFLDSSK